MRKKNRKFFQQDIIRRFPSNSLVERNIRGIAWQFYENQGNGRII